MQFTYIAIALLSSAINTAFAAPTPYALPMDAQPATIPDLETRDSAIYARSLENAALIARAEQAEQAKQGAQHQACWPYCGNGWGNSLAYANIGVNGINAGVYGNGYYGSAYINNGGIGASLYGTGYGNGWGYWKA